MRSFRVEMLGTARVLLADGSIHPLKPTIRDQALAFLAVSDSWVTRDRLGFLFWADSPDSTARHNVRQLLKRMRQLEWLEGLESNESAVRWSVPNDVADLHEAVTNEAWDALPLSGELLPGMERNASVEFEEWLFGQRQGVHATWQSAVLAAARHAMALGAPGHGLELLEPLLASDDGSEVLPAYMELAIKAGRRGLAKAGFDRVAARLRTELGVDPPARAREMAERLATGADSEPVLPSGIEAVGRAGELTEITGLMARPECRLLTLFGPGGIGKSTMAHLVADEMKGRYLDGAALVSLEAVQDPDDVAASIASELALSLDARIDPVNQLVAAIGRRHMLLVLDNAEHIRPAWVLFSELLASCPSLELLVTSRERLRLEGEWVYELRGLADEDGVALFLERGRRVAPGASVSVEEAGAICRAVGGSPLGIELAVPWLRVMAPSEIVSEIQRDPELLSGGYRDGLARHESVTATMRHSWDLASPRQREMVEALSTFAAPYTRELANAVSGATATDLRDLLDQSLVHRREAGRYSSHPLVRAYASARLAEDATRHQKVRRRHAAVILELVGAGAESPNALLEDVVAAWQYCVESGAVGLIVPAIDSTTDLMVAGGRLDRGLQLLGEAVASLDEDTAEWAALRCAESRLLYLQARHAEAARAAEEALRGAVASNDQLLQVRANLALGWARKWIEGDAAQYAAISEALLVAEAIGDPNLTAEVLNGLGCSAATLEICAEHLQQGLDTADSTTLDLRARLLSNLGMVLWALGNGRSAIDHVRQALNIARSLDDQNRIVESLSSLAFVHADLGDLDDAMEMSAEAESLAGTSEFLNSRIYVRLIAGEVRRLIGDSIGAGARARDALTMAASVGNEAFTTRALRLHGQLFLETGEIDQGLGTLAFVLSRTANKGGDFTSEIINPRAWNEAIEDVSPKRIEAAKAWAMSRSLDDVVAEAHRASSEWSSS